MLSIEKVAIIADKVILFNGRYSNIDELKASDFLFTCGDTVQPGERLQLSEINPPSGEQSLEDCSVTGFSAILTLNAPFAERP